MSSGAEKRKDDFGVRLRIEGACSLSHGQGRAWHTCHGDCPRLAGVSSSGWGLQGLVCVSSSLRGR